MNNEAIFILLDRYADWEGSYLAAALHNGLGLAPNETPRYVVRTAAPDFAPVASIGGFATLPDYSFDLLPDDCAALVLIGGLSWQSAEAERLTPIVERAIAAGRAVGAICNAVSWLAAHGFLNGVRHTGNTLEMLRTWGGEHYTNAAGYVERQAVSDGRIVTANGTAALEFSREMLLLLEADSPAAIEQWYDFHKHGFIR